MTSAPPVQVDLWLVPEPAGLPADLARDYAAMLSIDERQRWQRFRLPADRQRFLLSRALLRSVLSGYLEDFGGDELRFCTGPFGKPELLLPAGPAPLHFNLSHTRGMLVLAVSRQARVGVDVEMLQRRVKAQALIERYFSGPELAEYLALPEAERLTCFFTQWTVKEACLKALGTGLQIPLRSFSVSLTGRHPGIVWHESPDPDRKLVCRHWLVDSICSLGLAVGMEPERELQILLQQGLPLQGFG